MIIICKSDVIALITSEWPWDVSWRWMEVRSIPRFPFVDIFELIDNPVNCQQRHQPDDETISVAVQLWWLHYWDEQQPDQDYRSRHDQALKAVLLSAPSWEDGCLSCLWIPSHHRYIVKNVVDYSRAASDVHGLNINRMNTMLPMNQTIQFVQRNLSLM